MMEYTKSNASPSRNISLATAILTAGLLITPATAHAQPLSGKDLKNFVSGKTVLLNTRWGEFPLVYRTNGTVTGDGSRLGLARFFAPRETGKWWVAKGKLCQQWPTWYKGKRFCFSIAKTGEESLNWVREDGYSGTAKVRG